MKIRVLLIISSLFVSAKVLAQYDSSLQPQPSKLVYFNSFLAGGLLGKGERETSLTFSTTHGVRYKRFSLAGGIGYDVYDEWRMLPLFGSVGYDGLRLGTSAFFIQANGGYSLGWLAGEKEQLPNLDVRGGVMINPMVGYRIQALQYRIYISAGYKYQEGRYSFLPYSPYSDFRSVPKTTVTQHMNRAVLTIGVGWH